MTLTVKELIEKLNQIANKDLEVFTFDGCLNDIEDVIITKKPNLNNGKDFIELK